MPSAVVKLGHTPTRADCLHFIFAFTVVESLLAVVGPDVMILQHRNSLISLQFAVDNLSQEEIFCAVEMNIWPDGKLSAAEQSACC